MLENLDINDATNIAGIAELISKDDVPDGFDFQQLEDEIINSGIGYQPNNPTDNVKEQFQTELNRLSEPETNFSNSFDDVFKQLDAFETQSLQDFSMSNQPNNIQQSYNDNMLSNMTNEERNQRVITGVMNDMKTDAVSFNMEKEKEEDDKIRKLETINSLREILLEDRVDLSRIPEVSHGNTVEEIDGVLKILLLKNDRKRYTSFAEDSIMLFSHGVEDIFNGKRSFFGTSPDMTGWHKTVRNKLRRMRHDTSSVVSGVMQKYSLGSGTRIAIELIPSAIIYSRMKKSEKISNINDKQITDDEFESEYNKMRDYDQN